MNWPSRNSKADIFCCNFSNRKHNSAVCNINEDIIALMGLSFLIYETQNDVIFEKKFAKCFTVQRLIGKLKNLDQHANDQGQ